MDNTKINCGICYEDIETNNFNTLPCKHKICNNCFPKIRGTLCPFCRNPFRASEPIDIPNNINSLVVNRNTLQNNNPLEYALNIENRIYRTQRRRTQRRRTQRRNRRTRNPNNERVYSVSYETFEFTEEDERNPIVLMRDQENNQESNKEENDNQHRTNNRNTRRNRRRNRWNDLSNQFPFHMSI